MKISFVYPGISGVGFNSYGKSHESSWISHGLTILSSCVKKEGHEAGLIDLRKLRGWNHFENIVKREAPEVLAVSMMSVDYNPALKSIDLAKNINGNIITAVGGPHPSIMPEELEPNRNIDHIFLGEGEISFPCFLRDITEKKKPKRIIKGIKPDLDDIPFADRELFGAFEKPIYKKFHSPFVTVIAGRGCIYNCNFCQPAERIIFGREVRIRSVDNVMWELIFLREKYGFKSLMLHDDCLLEDVNWVEEFCEKYKTHGFNQPFICQSRADLICRNEELIRKMKDSGLKILIIGFESGSQRVLNFLRKGTKVEHNYKAAEICRRHGIKIWANYMMGIPTETKDEVMETAEMIRKIKPDFCSPAFYTPHPGSDLYEYCIKNNLSLITSHDGFRRNPTEPKIKGVDYNFLNNAVLESRRFTPWMRFRASAIGRIIVPAVKKMLKIFGLR
ncbi:MAG: radical SAM protein [Armatimonadota bacterium]